MKLTYHDATSESLIEARAAGLAMNDWSPGRLHYLPVMGYFGRDETGKMQGIGCVIWIGKGINRKAVGVFSITDELRGDPAVRWIFKRAVEVIRTVHLVTPRIYAAPDPEIEKAIPFMQRLGFVPAEDGLWVCDASVAVYLDGGVGGRLVCNESAASEI